MPQTKVLHELAAECEAVTVADEACSEDLKGLNMTQLRKLWYQRMGRKDPPRIKSLLLRELAWHEQQAVQGGMDAQTRALLRSAIKQVRSTSAHHDSRSRRTPQKQPRSKPDLQPGTKLIRTWRGRQHEVIVRDIDNAGGGGGGRFEYNGETFRGLTAIAEKITGAHWSGPRFFGLNKVRASR
jgi:Protein of unknown function (DUF2924)